MLDLRVLKQQGVSRLKEVQPEDQVIHCRCGLSLFHQVEDASRRPGSSGGFQDFLVQGVNEGQPSVSGVQVMTVEQLSDCRKSLVLPTKVTPGLLYQGEKLICNGICRCRKCRLELQPVVFPYEAVLLDQVLDRLEQFRTRPSLGIEGVKYFTRQLQSLRFQLLQLVRQRLDLRDTGFQSNLGLRLGGGSDQFIPLPVPVGKLTLVGLKLLLRRVQLRGETLLCLRVGLQAFSQLLGLGLQLALLRREFS